jgi:hypothetical protein
MGQIDLIGNRCKAKVLSKRGRVVREYDVTGWTVDRYFFLREEMAAMGFDVKIGWAPAADISWDRPWSGRRHLPL